MARPDVDANKIVLVGRSFGGALAPRGAAGEPRLAAMIVDPGQFDMGATVTARLGALMDKVNDPTADAQFDSLLDVPALNALLRSAHRHQRRVERARVLRRHAAVHEHGDGRRR